MIKFNILVTCFSIAFILYEYFFEKAIKKSEELENIKSKDKNASCLFKILLVLIFTCITIISAILNDDNGLIIILFFFLQVAIIAKIWSGDVRYILRNLIRYYNYKKDSEGSISACLKTFFAVFVTVIMPAIILIIGFF